MNTNFMLQERMKKSKKSLASAFTMFCPQIAGGSKSTDLVSPSYVKVNVEVDDSRFVSFSMYSSYGGFVLLVLSTQFQNGLLFYIEAEGHANSVIF
jgi:hypothetical protein